MMQPIESKPIMLNTNNEIKEDLNKRDSLIKKIALSSLKELSFALASSIAVSFFVASPFGIAITLASTIKRENNRAQF